MPKHLWLQDRFFPGAPALRSVFDERFRDPKATTSQRFVWDYWHVPDQYTLVRTPADHFFPQKIYGAFLQHLVRWGQENLGCWGITPPWLSYYVEGCQQQLHSDVPHGPWAFVFSLSPKRLGFKGGETLLLRPQVLQYWQNFQDAKDRELSSFVERVAPKFNRLVVFDPRLPHGVTPVTGTRDPREARLVVHGWFTEPKPFLQGALRAKQVAPVLDEAVQGLVDALAQEGRCHGVLSVRVGVSPSGVASSPEILADSLVSLEGNNKSKPQTLVRKYFSGLRFPAAHGRTRITLPLLFR